MEGDRDEEMKMTLEEKKLFEFRNIGHQPSI